jgi:hypothetical protein
MSRTGGNLPGIRQEYVKEQRGKTLADRKLSLYMP